MIAGQHEVFLGNLGRGMSDRDRRNRQRFRILGQSLILRVAAGTS